MSKSCYGGRVENEDPRSRAGRPIRMAIPVWHARMKIAIARLKVLFPVPQSNGMLFAFFSDDVLVALVLLPSGNQTSICGHRVLLQRAARPVFTQLNEQVEQFPVFAGLDEGRVQG